MISHLLLAEKRRFSTEGTPITAEMINQQLSGNNTIRSASKPMLCTASPEVPWEVSPEPSHVSQLRTSHSPAAVRKRYYQSIGQQAKALIAKKLQPRTRTMWFCCRRQNSLRRHYKLLHENSGFPIAAVHNYKISFCKAFLSKACFVITACKVLMKIRVFTLPKSTQPLHSCPGPQRNATCHTVEEEVRAHTDSAWGRAGACIPADSAAFRFTAEGSFLHKTIRNPSLTWQLNQAVG